MILPKQKSIVIPNELNEGANGVDMHGHQCKYSHICFSELITGLNRRQS